jgi:amino acid permease
MMNQLFDFCVAVMVWLGKLTHLSYKEINIWIFVIIGPIFMLAMIIALYRQHQIIRKLKAQILQNGNQ